MTDPTPRDRALAGEVVKITDERLKAERDLASTLTKRELLAAMALQGMLASTEYCFGKTAYAEHAVQHADALLKELAK